MKVNWKFVREVLHSAESIERVQLAVFTLAPFVQVRSRLTRSEFQLSEEAVEWKRKEGVPYWDALLLRCVQRGEFSRSIIRAALWHQGPSRLIHLNRARILDGGLSIDLAPNEVLAFTSLCETASGEPLHVPLLDFHVPHQGNRPYMIRKVVEELGLPGRIVRSGKSYHFYGCRAERAEVWAAHLGRALLLSPVVDRCWIGHQLQQGYSALRISVKPGHILPPQQGKYIAVNGDGIS